MPVLQFPADAGLLTHTNAVPISLASLANAKPLLLTCTCIFPIAQAVTKIGPAWEAANDFSERLRQSHDCPRKQIAPCHAANHAFATVFGIRFGTHPIALEHSIRVVFHPPESPVSMPKNLLIDFNLDQLGEPREYRPPAERVIEGDIVCRNWDVDSAKDDKVRAGVWESTPGVNRSIKGETWEFCLILSGVVELTEDGQSPVVYKAGDCFIMKPGYTGTWRTLETVRKVWIMA